MRFFRKKSSVFPYDFPSISDSITAAVGELPQPLQTQILNRAADIHSYRLDEWKAGRDYWAEPGKDWIRTN